MDKIFTFKDLIGGGTSLLSYREDLEWSNFWYDSANKECTTRYLLIGDSTARMVRSTLAKISMSPVDLLASSSAIDDNLFINQVDTFFKDNIYKYDAIFVQIGHHSRKSKEGTTYTKSDYLKFERDYEILCKYLMQYTPNVYCEGVFMSVKRKNVIQRFLRKLNLPILEKPDEKENCIKRNKNQIIRKVATKLGLMYIDLPTLIEGKFYHTDHIHYETAAKIYIAKEMLKYVYSSFAS